MSVNDVLTTQQQLSTAIENLYTNFKKDGSDRKTPDYIKRRLNALDDYWFEYEKNYQHLSQLDMDVPSRERIDQERERLKERFDNIRAHIQNYQPLTEDRPGTTLLKPPTFVSKTNSITPQISTRSTSSKTEEMLKKQNSNFKAFQRTLSNINLELVSEKWEFEDLLRTLQSRWAAIDALHWELDSELDGSNEAYEETFSFYEQKFSQVKKDINTKMWSESHREKSTPQMDIPTFTGNYHQWVSFKDLFCEAVHTNRTLSNAQKMQFLKSKLRGEPEKMVQHLHISSDNYQVCWDLLNHRYNNNKLIFGSHINILLNLPIAQQQSAAQFKKIYDSVNESLNAIKNLGIDISSWDPLVVHILSQKIDVETHKDYIESLKNPRDLPTLADFLNFLENKFTSLVSSRRKQDSTTKSSQPETTSHRKKPHYFKSFTSNQNQVTNYAQKNSQTGCPLCKNENHGIFHCSNFLKLQPTERRNTIAKLKYCFNCLYDHYGKNCISAKRCRECNGRSANTLIHEAYVKPLTSTTEQRRNASNVSQNNINETLLAIALVKVQCVNGTYIKIRALIDQGSQTSLITEKAAQMLQLPRQRCKGVIFGVGAKENNCKGVINITCSSAYSDYQFTSDVFIMKNLINNLPNKTFDKPDWSYLENIQLADPEFNVSRPVDLLLGADVYSSIILGGIISSQQSQPVAQQTRLGWILCGNVKSYQCNVIMNNIDEIQRFWEIEHIPDELTMTQEDAQCLEYFKNTTTRQEDGKYIVRLPFISEAVQKLGESKSRAIAQFKQLEKKIYLPKRY
ncbi:unnamed protein product [Parnassius apollo]|uniref:(apollo) hypothetical protein n=1 Tax=Parnassius apollo TaxID=110799 RepID=A0A8S3XGU2_PARAO|nr:unnamed protein product [Parnassius apollo]